MIDEIKNLSNYYEISDFERIAQIKNFSISTVGAIGTGKTNFIESLLAKNYKFSFYYECTFLNEIDKASDFIILFYNTYVETVILIKNIFGIDLHHLKKYEYIVLKKKEK